MKGLIRFHPALRGRKWSRTLPIAAVCIAILLAGTAALAVQLHGHTSALGFQGPPLPGGQVWQHSGMPVSSYLYGSSDLAPEGITPNIETSAAVQTALMKAGITIIRTDFPDNASDAAIDQRVQTIANTGAQCLGTITNPANTAFDLHLVTRVGSRCSFWEVGIAPDAVGIPVSTYVQQWVHLVPQLRNAEPRVQLKFIGPATATENHAYIDGFLRGAKTANVLPDIVSYEWFPCVGMTQAQCAVQATTVGRGVQDVQALTQQDSGTSLPVAITAWNAQLSTRPSAYVSNAGFIGAFTTSALAAMANAGVAIADQTSAASGAGGGSLDMVNALTGAPKSQLIAMQTLIQLDRPCVTNGQTPMTPPATGTAVQGAMPVVPCPPCPTASVPPGTQVPGTLPTTPVPSATTSGVPPATPTSAATTPTTPLITAPGVTCTPVPCTPTPGATTPAISPTGTVPMSAPTGTATTTDGSACAPGGVLGLSSWPAFNGGGNRAGGNRAETTITAATVSKLTRLYQVQLTDIADSSPVFAPQVMTAKGMKNLLLVTTSHAILLAIDASDDQARGQVVWQAGAASSGSRVTTSSPAIDPNGQFVYSYSIDGTVHRYAIGTGKDITGGGWPVSVTTMPLTEKGSSALNIGGGFLYAALSGFVGDGTPYVGHLVAVNLTTGRSTVFNALCQNIKQLVTATGATSCPAQRAGIWARAGVVVDAPPPNGTGNVFAVTGNGAFDANTGGQNYGDTILELSPDLTRLVDSYTPPNFPQLQASDADLGSSAPALLPVLPQGRTPSLSLVQVGKDSTIRVLNRQNLSGMGGPNHVGGAVQKLSLPQRGAVYTQPAVWTDGQSGTSWVFIATGNGFAALTAGVDATGKSVLTPAYNNAVAGSSPIVVGGGAATAVVFVQGAFSLHALAPTTGKVLWSSAQPSAKGTVGPLHWQSPIVVNGRAYVLDNAGQLSVYGLPSGM